MASARAVRGMLSLALLALLAVAALAYPVPLLAGTGSYANSVIADTALKYKGQWGGNACADAHRSGLTGSTTTYPAPATRDSTGKVVKPGDGQCRSFVNCVVWIASNHTQWLGGEADGTYFGAFVKAGGTEITSADTLAEGDIVQVGNGTHTFIIIRPSGGNSFEVVDSNSNLDEQVREHSVTVMLGTNERAFRMGTVQRSVAPSSHSEIVVSGRVGGWESLYELRGDGSGVRTLKSKQGPVAVSISWKNPASPPSLSKRDRVIP